MKIVHDARCPLCGGPLATVGRRDFCPAVVPKSGGEPCGYGLRGGLDDQRPGFWRDMLALTLARIKAVEWRARNRRVRAATRRVWNLANTVEQVP